MSDNADKHAAILAKLDQLIAQGDQLDTNVTEVQDALGVVAARITELGKQIAALDYTFATKRGTS